MDADTLAGHLGVRLPAGTRILGVTANDERDGFIRAKLEMPAAQVSAFLTDAKIKNLEQAGPDLLGPDEGYWDPHRAGPLRSGEAQLPGARFLLVAVDAGRPELAAVYVIAHGT